MSFTLPTGKSPRFNPPPNWPAPPPGWTPPPGWAPDPSWPPPPERWQLWVDDPGTAGTPPPRPQRPTQDGKGHHQAKKKTKKKRMIIAGAGVAVVLSAIVISHAMTGSSSLADGPASASCKIGWTDLNDYLSPGGQVNFFATQSAANNWANQNDSDNSNVGPIFQFTVTANQTVNIAGVTVVYYNGSGTEISSTTANVGQTLTDGQSYTGYGLPYAAPAGTASCQVVEVDQN